MAAIVVAGIVTNMRLQLFRYGVSNLKVKDHFGGVSITFVTCFHTFFADFLVHTVKLKPIIKANISGKLVTKVCSRSLCIRENCSNA